MLLSGKKYFFPALWPPEYLDHARSLGEDSPLLSAGTPSPDEEEEDPESFPDPTGESSVSPLPFVHRKFEDRILLLTTSRCFFYCRFCFRRGNQPGGAREPSMTHLLAVRDYLEQNSEIEEVILSGGDPLTLDNQTLAGYLKLFGDVKSIKRLRIHTRAPVVFPERVDEGLVNTFSLSEKPVRLVLHAIHHSELRPAFEGALSKLQKADIQVQNQTVLLKGINEEPEVLGELFSRLEELGVRTRYLHHTDRAKGNKRFRVDILSGLSIHSRLSAITRGDLPPYVIDLPDGSGKVAVSSLCAVGEERSGGLLRTRYAAPLRGNAKPFEWWDIWRQAGARPTG